MKIGKRFFEQHWGDGSNDTSHSSWRRVINGKDHLFQREQWEDRHWIMHVEIAHYLYPGAKYVDHYEHARTFVCCGWFRAVIDTEFARDGLEPLPVY